MVFTGIETLNDTSLEGILAFPSLEMPSFWPLILFAIYIIVTLSSYFSERETERRGNLLSSLAVAGFVNVVLSGILSIIGIIDRTTLIISIVISSIFIGIYMLTKN